MTKPFLVDVPVKIVIWCRPDCQKKQWEVIRKARPSILFIQSDGGRTDLEWEYIKQNRKMIDDGIDWDCTVYRNYEDENVGMYASSKKIHQLIWSKVDRAIFLEDDDVPSVSFFKYCAELLEKYKNDPRIECICGHNHFGTWDKCNSDYFFSKQGSIHGFATWKRVFEERGCFDYYNDSYVMGLLKEATKKNKIAWKRLNAYGKQDYFEGHVASSEFWIEFNMYSQSRLQIVPKHNLICNVGIGVDSTHLSDEKMSKKIKSVFNMETYELVFPLKHPKYVIPDVVYEKKRNKLLGYNEPAFARFLKRILRIFLVFFTDPKYFWKRLFSKRKKKDVER